MVTEDRVPTLTAITEHIDREARRIGTYHGDPAATPGGTGYCIPAAVATQIVDKYLSAQPAPPLDVGGGHRHGPDEFICDDGDCPRSQPAPPLDVLARKIVDRIVLSYRLSTTRAADVAKACDEVIDSTGNLLGWLREYERLARDD